MTDPHDILHRPMLVGLTADGWCAPAVRVANELSARFEAPLELVHAIPSAHHFAALRPGIDIAQLDEHRRVAARQALQPRLADLGIPAARQADILRVESGAPARVLVQRARELDAGVVFVGRHRPRTMLDLGSTARAIMTHAPCAIWSQAEPGLPLRRLLVPVDLSEDSRHAVAVAALLAGHLGASLQLLHAFSPPPLSYPPKLDVDLPGMIREAWHTRFDEFVAEVTPDGVETTGTFVDEEPVDAVLSRQFDVDLIVMATQGRGKLSSAVLGSVTYGVLRHAARPVLAVPHPADLAQRGKMSVDSFHVTA